MKLILKGCPRCGGDLMPDRWDLDGEDMCCVQCGHSVAGALVREVRSTYRPVAVVAGFRPEALQRRVA
jgi:hypothetical protein